VVIAISQVATNANSKPLTNVVIQNVLIRRVGSAAQAFDINAQNLPQVTNLPLKIANSSGQISLAFSNRLYADNRFTTQPILPAGVLKCSDRNQFAGHQHNLPSSGQAVSILFNCSGPVSFFDLCAQDASCPARDTQFQWRAGTITNNFDGAGGGTYSYHTGTNNSQGTIDAYSWTQEPYRGTFGQFIFRHCFHDSSIELHWKRWRNFNGTAYNPPHPSQFPARSR